MIVYILMQILEVLLKVTKKIVTNKALQRVFIVSLLGMIVLDSTGVFTFRELFDVALQIYINTFKGIVEAIIAGVQSIVEWVNNQIIDYIKNQVLNA
ncbi:hypothetical protein DJ83_16955 [Halorubrum ezzemoulense]|uniref:Uncharacterized protein n=2 Tax=Halorubrum ezzemoulense TaxID=337243 RepID=A0A256ILK9_HALEZ|nr:hypothetical protein DJ83_16955 [Halorubrum ezzemoulense]